MLSTMTRQALLEKVRHSAPALGWDREYPDLFGVYGSTMCGICDGWKWFEEDNISDTARAHGHKPLTDASDAELLEMFALAQDYWLIKYEEWLEQAKKKALCLDNFIGHCERKYFGYDEDGYTDKTIHRVLSSVLEVLEKDSDKRKEAHIEGI